MSSNGQFEQEGGESGAAGGGEPGAGQQGPLDNAKANEYVKELLKEKINLDPGHCPNAMRLIDDEVVKAQTKGKIVKESRYVDIYREKPVRVAVKVLVPVKEHPRFNFVGKLLGPKGNSLKRLQEETMTRMAILGRGSMRDKQKEEECRNTLDPKYSHLSEELHVEIVALAPPAEAHARIAYALAEIRKYLVPDNNDEIRLEQLREIQASSGPQGGGSGPRGRAPRGGPPAQRHPPPRGGMMGGISGRPVGGKTKVLSILERARVAMEESFGDYDDSAYYEHPPFPSDFNNGGDYYESGYSDGSAGRWKGYKSSGGAGGQGGGGGGGGAVGGGRFGARSAPYSRPSK